MGIAEVSQNCGAVLIVEDEVLVRGFLTKFLQELGYKVIEAALDEEALAQILYGSEDIGIVLAEASIGRKGGIALMEEVGKLKPAIEFLIMSGFSSLGNLAFQQLEREGRFLSKPFSLELLTQKVDQCLKL